MINVNDTYELEWRPGLTVRDVLEAMGRTQGLFTVVVDGQIMPRADYGSSTLEDGSRIHIFPISHGG